MAIWTRLKDKVVTSSDYYLMHEDYELAKFSVRGDVITKLELYTERDLVRRLPFIVLYSNSKEETLAKWIRDRAATFALVDKEEKDEAKDNSFSDMLKNLGLSMSDHYWIKPVDGDYLEWKDVNCYTNDFVTEVDETDYNNRLFTPNTTLQGDLYKRWILTEDDKRVLVKADWEDERLSSYFEVFASRIHKSQERFKCVKYGLVELDLTDDIQVTGCQCGAFTNKDRELVHMEGLSYIKKYENFDMYERVIELCKALFKLDIRKFLEYQIMTDFLMTNIDRDFTNFGILRDSHDLRALCVAPIYDSGHSLGLGLEDNIDILKIQTNSFFYYELEGLSRVKNKGLVDIKNLPSVNNLYNLLAGAEVDEQKRLATVQLYEEKMHLLEDFQNGRKFRL